MNKANTREFNMALYLLDVGTRTGDEHYTNMACRLLSSVQRCGTEADTRTVLALINERGLQHKFYTENHCLLAID
jgi:hypothetical protein